MPAADLSLLHTFQGGLATDFGGLADIDVDTGRRVRVPFLTRADNIYYGASGQLLKISGINKYNSVTIESGEEIRGLFEYTKIGAAGNATRKKLVAAGTKILADNNDGTFASIITGRTDNAVPHFNTFADTAIIASDNVSDVPKKWDQTTAGDLGGSPPRFSFSVTHANRLWVAGNWSAPSRLYYSESLDPEIWNSGSAGSIDVDPNDGDYITGIYAFRGSLLVFKGPNTGSIHVISGLTTTTFSRAILAKGVGAIWQNMIFALPNDVGFVSLDGTIRSVTTTQKFGDLEVGKLSAPIDSLLQSNVSIAQLRKGWAATDFSRGYTLFTFPFGADTKPTILLIMDFRFQPTRFALWPATTAWSCGLMSDPSDSSRPILFVGGNDGFVRKTQQATQGVDGVAISAYARTPAFHYSTANRGKTISHIGLSLKVSGAVTMSLSILRETGDTNTSTLTVGSGAVLGSFVLGTDSLAGNSLKTKWADTTGTGQAREIAYEISNTVLAQTFTVEAMHIVLEQSAAPIYE